jgi:two-component system, OmpR family, sensor kinase
VARPRTLRVRLALVFGLTTTVVAAIFGTIVLHKARLQLAHGIDEGLVPVATELAIRVAREGPGVIAGPAPELHPPSDAIAQVLDESGRILTTSGFPGDTRPLLGPAEAHKVASSDKRMRRQLTIDAPTGGTQAARLLAVPVTTATGRVVLVAATSFDEALSLEEDLERALAAGLPILAAGVALGGWLLTGAMFKPVRSMIEQADRISAEEPKKRLEISGGGAELRMLASRLNFMLDRIEDAAARERGFLDDASHELRTPISIVRGELELTLDRARSVDEPELVASLDSVLDEVERLEQLAHNLLVLARSRSGNLTAGEEPVDLETTVERAVRAVHRRAENQHIAIHCAGNAVVDGDESALQRAVLNLLDNAVRYASTEVTVSIEAHPASVILMVVDDGPGFGDLLPQAFDRFTRDPGQGGGMGLGLAITAAIATAHGGYVSADNRPSGGAQVCLRLPAA